MTPRRHNSFPAASSPGRARRHFAALTLTILLAATVWRIAIATQMPALARDGVTFCWYAEALGEQGFSYLADPAAQQHPLYPALILAAQRVAAAFSVPPSPSNWRFCGQIVAGIAGLAVILLSGWLAARLVRRLDLPLDAHHAALLAMLLAAFVPLNIWLSADVMSDQVHLTFYLGAVGCLLSLRRTSVAVACGLLAGLAFLTRQEGIVPLAAGLVALFLDRCHPARARLGSAAALTAAFLLLAVPYWALVGGFSQKKDPADWILQRDEAAASPLPAPARIDTPPANAALIDPVRAADRDDAAGQPGCVRLGGEAPDRIDGTAITLAKLEPIDLGWYAVAPYALYMLLRAGRIVVPLLAFLPITNVRRRLLQPPLAGVTACFVGHFLLTNVLLYHYQYLSTRHMLVLVMLLVPFAAFLLTRIQALAFQRGRRALAWIAVGVPLLPLLIYGLRVPNAEDGFLVDAARWLRAHDANIEGKRLISGSSGRRIAFYAGMTWDPWYEKPEQFGELLRTLEKGGAGYLAIEVGTGFERAGNDALVERLRTDPAASALVEPLEVLPGPDEENELHVFAVSAGVERGETQPATGPGSTAPP